MPIELGITDNQAMVGLLTFILNGACDLKIQEHEVAAAALEELPETATAVEVSMARDRALMELWKRRRAQVPDLVAMAKQLTVNELLGKTPPGVGPA